MNVVATDEAPKAIGPYSQAIDTGDAVYCSGQIPLDPETMKIVEGDITVQTGQVFSNIRNVLKAAGMDLNNVVKTTVFLADLNDFAAMNDVYAYNFGLNKPARSTVQVAKLPLDALVEIECIAVE